MIAVVNYGIGNLRSIVNALDRIEAPHAVVDRAGELSGFDKLLLPGVGAFGDCATALRAAGFEAPILEHVREHGKPLLGICVGMQLLAEVGTEFGSHAGLGLIGGKVVQIQRYNPDLRLPHVGWNNVRLIGSCPLFQGLDNEATCYFVHSYHFVPTDRSNIAAEVDYGGPVTASVSAPPIYGVQFHPEKSQSVGLRILSNFASL